MLKETIKQKQGAKYVGECVSIPSRGSGKGDVTGVTPFGVAKVMFQSPLGEVVKETLRPGSLT